MALKKKTIREAEKNAWDTKHKNVDIINPKDAWNFINAMRSLPN